MRITFPSLISRIRTLLLIVVFLITSDAMAATISSVGTGNWSATAWPNTARTGTITTSNVSATVTGAGGSLILSEISVGNIIKTAGNVVIGTVLSVTNNTTLILTVNALSTNAGIAYHVQGIGSGDIAQISGGNTITVDIASAACVSFQSNPAAPFTPATLVFNLNSHLTVSGLVTVGDLSGHALSIDMTNGGIVTCHGFTFDNAGAWTPGAGTVEFTATTTLPAGPFVLNNLTISGGTTTTAATLTINGNLSIADGATFSAGGFALTVTGTTTVGGGTSGNLTVSAAAGAKSFNGLVTINAGGTWNNSGNSPITFHAGITNSGTFTAGTGVQTFNTNAQALSGTFSIPSITVTGFTLTNNNTLTVTTALIGTGTLAQAANATLNINFTGAPGITGLTATANGNTVDYGFAGTQTVFSTNYYHLLLSNTSAKTLQAGTTTISGNFTLSGTASATAVIGLTIAGNITIGLGTTFNAVTFTHNLAGNWSRTGTFTAGTSTIIFNGSAVQTVTATGGENFISLTINNSGAGIQLVNAIVVSTTLTMTQGNIDLNGNNLTLGVSAANNGTLVYTAGTFINTGTFIRWFKTAAIINGSVSGLFPMGTATKYRPFYVSAPVAGPITGGTIAVGYTDATTNTIVSFPDGASTVVVRKDLNWAVTTANGLVGGIYNLDIQGTGFGSIGNINDLRITLSNSVVGVAGVNAGSTVNPQINRTGLTLANLTNTFYLGSINFAITNLPITLISFTASVLDKQVELDWSTSSEINNDYFTVQRTKDAVIWESIQRVAGAGNSKTISSYTVFDQNPDGGKSYYRLMQTDFDGKQTYSAIRSVDLENGVSAISIYPNPATDFVRIAFPATDQFEVTLLNSNGQMMISPIQSTGNSLLLNVSRMEPGFYFLHINQKNVSEIRKIIIRR
ncbi:MAG TPA: T9SS type A sorting domain-containing protein [Puia sp.]|nr:T9SS type A sorting domain-containing protein [Puia sp.]